MASLPLLNVFGFLILLYTIFHTYVTIRSTKEYKKLIEEKDSEIINLRLDVKDLQDLQSGLWKKNKEWENKKGIKKIKIYEDLPIEEKLYDTKFATKWTFDVKKIIVDKKTGKQLSVQGLYSNNPEQICPLDIGRLIADKKEIGEKDVCAKCNHPIDEKYEGKKLQNENL